MPASFPSGRRCPCNQHRPRGVVRGNPCATALRGRRRLEMGRRSGSLRPVREVFEGRTRGRNPQVLADWVADSLWIDLRISGPGLHARTASIRACEGSARRARVACGLRPADAMAPRNHAKASEDSNAALMELVSALERATDTANPRSLSQLLGSLEQMKAIAWGRLLATAAPPERTPAEPLDDLRHLTPLQVAELLNLKEAYVHELCRSRQIPDPARQVLDHPGDRAPRVVGPFSPGD